MRWRCLSCWWLWWWYLLWWCCCCRWWWWWWLPGKSGIACLVTTNSSCRTFDAPFQKDWIKMLEERILQLFALPVCQCACVPVWQCGHPIFTKPSLFRNQEYQLKNIIVMWNQIFNPDLTFYRYVESDFQFRSNLLPSSTSILYSIFSKT